MRPTHLVISAFGPYAEKVEIDLSKLGRNGLYLIAGDTGAGKTTIFDAISYALFGEASGENRDEPKLFRCITSSIDVPTFVELTFEYDGKEYRIRRNPEYERRALRGTGTAAEHASVKFYLPEADGRVGVNSKPIEGDQAVDTAVANLIGIDHKQFRQLAMIAQGDFMDVLLATTEERQKIFRNIFRTEKFDTFQELLKTRADEAVTQCRDAEKIANHNVSEIQCAEDSVDAPKVQELVEIAGKDAITDWNEVCELLKRILDEDVAVQEKCKTEIDVLKKKLSEVDAEIGKAKIVDNARTALDTAVKALDVESKKVEGFKAAKEQEEDRKPERDALQESITTIKNSLDQYVKLDSKRNELDKQKKLLESNQEKLSTGASTVANLKKEISNLEKEQVDLANASERKAVLENAKNELDRRKTSLKNIATDIKKQDDEQLALNKAQDEFMVAYRAYSNLDAQYKNKERAFLSEQAGILAETLEEGYACPVCGSPDHPHKACKSEEAPTQNELEQMKDEVSAANEKQQKKSEAAKVLKSALDMKKTVVRDSLKELFDEATAALELDEVKEKIRVEFDDLKSRMTELSDSLDKEMVRINRKLEVDRILPEKRSDLEMANAANTEREKAVTGAATIIGQLESEIADLAKSLTFESRKVAEQKMAELQAVLNTMELKLQKAVQAYNTCNEKISGFESSIETLKQQLEGALEYNLEELQGNRAAIDGAMKKSEAILGAASLRVGGNSKRYEILSKSATELQTMTQTRDWIVNLSKTINGDLKGKNKIKLETYVQSAYFDRVVQRANIRFRILSNGQYSLVRREESANKRSKFGLDLDVVDHSSGRQRAAKTLSGGESFLASLSLALGLADEVQSSAGGIQLDTMFIDEGFGSLDEESLKSAIHVLQNLAGDTRLVGIISHVSELDGKIDKVVRVTKDQNKVSHVNIEV